MRLTYKETAVTQFEQPYGQVYEQTQTGPPRTSGLAIASLICSLLICCPFLPSLLGLVFGLIAFVAIGRNPVLRGRGLAIAGILIGVIGVGGWSAITVYAVDVGKFIMQGPNEALASAASGDISGFKSYCWGPAVSASDEEAKQFITDLEARYGAFVSCRMDETPRATQAKYGSPIVPFPYVIQCKDASVKAEIEIAFSDPQRGGFLKNIASFRVFDSDRGDLKYPPDQSAGGP